MPRSSQDAPVEATAGRRLTCRITPGGAIVLQEDAPDAGPALETGRADSIRHAFESGRGAGILHLGAAEPTAPLSPALAFWRDLGREIVSGACMSANSAAPADIPEPPPDPHRWEWRILSAPPMEGGEFLDAALLERVSRDVRDALRQAATRHPEGVAGFLADRSDVWNLVGRVCLHLAEVKRNPEKPFAFLATYVEKISAAGTATHRPLGRAMSDYAGQREKLLALLAPVSRACESSETLRDLVDSGQAFRPLAWTAAEAYRFLTDIPKFEAAGLAVRVPDWWNAHRPPRPRVTVSVGDAAPVLGADWLLDFRIEVSMDGETLTQEEVRALLTARQGLALVRGKWVEVDPERLSSLLRIWEAVQERARTEGIGFGEAMRLVSGLTPHGEAHEEDAGPDAHARWSEVVACGSLRERLARLRAPEFAESLRMPPEFQATLRPYQETGVAWLATLRTLGLGGCLADDMGLGKTVQVLACLLGNATADASETDLLVVPASLIDNWTQEAARFAPSLRILVAHPSRMSSEALKRLASDRIDAADAVVVSYGALSRYEWLHERRWRSVTLDEAQAIKNPGTAQSRAARRLRDRWRVALTGTPIENRLGDLWSIFEFLNPGLLGTASQFDLSCRSMAESREGYAPLRRLTQPFLLRRLKTDRSVISDLPDKTEVRAWCYLTRAQAALYGQAVEAARSKLEDASGIERRGLVLAFLTCLKQICNHPSQWLADGAWDAGDSGKFARLAELCDAIRTRQDKVLVFTQFRSVIDPISSHLAGVFGRPGLTLHGGTPVRQRQRHVQAFQEDDRIPFMVVSLKAGGSGLNLAAASHVIHFDRWWNPAVENQATDRAFRIGQKNPVLVHKFVCKGTVEERIDGMMEEKAGLSADVLSDGMDSIHLTELSDEELFEMVSIDLQGALAGAP